MADGLDAGYDAVLFHGLTVNERIEVGEGMALLPFEQVRAFVDEELVHELAPPGAGFHGYRSVGALARTYRWRPALCRAGYERELVSHNPLPFPAPGAALPRAACRGARDTGVAAREPVAPH